MTDKRKAISLKAVRVEAWEKARRAAARTGEPLGEWISRAIEQLAEIETADRIIPPDRFAAAIPEALPFVPDHANGYAVPVSPSYTELAAVLSAMATAGMPVQKRVGRQVNKLLYQALPVYKRV